MISQLEHFVVDQVRERLLENKDGKLISIVRYTDCSWGGVTIWTSTFHGTNYSEIFASIDGAMDSLLKNVITYDGDTIGVSIKRVEDDSFFGRKDSSVFGCYINIYLGPIMGGDDLVPKLFYVKWGNEKKV